MDRDAALARLARRRTRVAGLCTAFVVMLYFGFILLIAYAKPLLATRLAPGLTLGIALGALVIVGLLALDLRVRALGEPPLRRGARRAAGVGARSVALLFFFVFIAITLGITYWAARRTRTAEHFYAAGRSISAGQNGFALAK